MAINLSFDNDTLSMEIDFSNALSSAAKVVESAAKNMCPVDTGRLKSSILSSVSSDTANISANTDYASYVEFGTSRASAQPYLVPALLNNKDAIIAAFTSALGVENG